MASARRFALSATLRMAKLATPVRRENECVFTAPRTRAERK